MEISPTLAAAAGPVQTQNPTSEISSDFETFLRMLTVQMQNQDPLNPVDSSDYAVQLATFSGVEQQVLTNDLLKGLAAQNGTSSLAQMASWVGMEARAAAPAEFNGKPLTLSPEPEEFATAAQLVVSDANGVEVQRVDIGVNTQDVTWAGVDENGAPFPQGTYTFETVSYDGLAEIGRNITPVYGLINEVRMQDGAALLTLDGGGQIAADSVTALRSPTS